MVQLNNTFEQLKVSEGGPAVQQKPSRPVKATLRTRQPLDLEGPELQPDSHAADSSTSSSAQLLALLSRLFAPLRRSPNFSATLQHVKGLLYDQQYLAAFGTESEEGERWREVYAARWVPSRAVIYQRIFDECDIAQHLGWKTPSGETNGGGGGERPRSEEEELEQERERAKLRRRLRQEGKSADEISQAVAELEQQFRAARSSKADSEGEGAAAVVDAIMIGAGAGSEVVALGAVLGVAAAGRASSGDADPTLAAAEYRPPPRVRVHAVDQGSWDVLLDKMAQGLRDAWPTLDSEHAEDEGGERQQPRFDVRFVKGNILDDKMITTAAGSSSPVIDFGSSSLRLITICFTITELLLQSRLETLRLLSTISRSAPSGTLFLIVESASLAQIPIGQEGRTYPLGKLLDHALCGSGGGGEKGGGAWEILKSEDAKWYRMPNDADEVYNAMGKGTKVKLENSRVVLRLYRKR
ncbi:hypothetical protein B0A53_04752 [Rhodotorula sp. CCFEE 5036]|nr:hypothetical protein B0A53_04752 [Rhodotorula sp. CCFEE 5036]